MCVTSTPLTRRQGRELPPPYEVPFIVTAPHSRLRWPRARLAETPAKPLCVGRAAGLTLSGLSFPTCGLSVELPEDPELGMSVGCARDLFSVQLHKTSPSVLTPGAHAPSPSQQASLERSAASSRSGPETPALSPPAGREQSGAHGLARVGFSLHETRSGRQRCHLPRRRT